MSDPIHKIAIGRLKASYKWKMHTGFLITGVSTKIKTNMMSNNLIVVSFIEKVSQNDGTEFFNISLLFKVKKQ